MTGRVGRLLAVGPAVLLAAWLLAGLPLVLVDALHPVPTVLLATALALPVLVVLCRLPHPEPTPVVATLATVAVAAGFAALAWTTAAEDVIPRRDPAVYAQTADWLADHGGLPVPARSEVFGGVERLEYQSPGFYERGDPPHVVPQFLTGTALALTPAGWLAGLGGITHGTAVVGALALLAVAGVAARLAGPWAAPAAALTLACLHPQLHQARSAFSELPAQLLLFGGLCLLLDAQVHARGRARFLVLALAGGLLGLVSMVRVDGLVDLLPLVPVLAVLTVREGRSAGLAAGGGLLGGLACGVVDGFALSAPYLEMLERELRLVTLGWGVVVVGTVLVALLVKRLPRVPYLPTAAATAVSLLALLAYAVRPAIHRPTFAPDDPVGRAVVALQGDLGLPADGPRTYAEHSMRWLEWWLGPVGLALGVLGLALLLRHVLRRPGDPALAFVLVGLGAMAAVVAEPSITPDHPWADRRFVPVAYPALVVGAVWLLAAMARRGGPVRIAAVVLAAASLGPTVAATAPLLDERTHRGVLAAIGEVCAALPPDAAVVLAGQRARNEWPQVLRGQCEVPVAIAPVSDPEPVVTAAAAAARARGHVPVVLADSAATARAVGAHAPRQVLDLRTTEADRQLVQRPTGTDPYVRRLWLGPVG